MCHDLHTFRKIHLFSLIVTANKNKHSIKGLNIVMQNVFIMKHKLYFYKWRPKHLTF
jgi:hypothetical protein